MHEFLLMICIMNIMFHIIKLVQDEKVVFVYKIS
jgi:hypothetical protein